MSKGQVIRGTPIRSISQSGIAASTPGGMRGTQPEAYTSDQRGYQSNPKSGTPYNSAAGNPDNARRVVEAGVTKGLIPDHTGQVPNDPRSNGSGTLFDNVSTDSATGRAAPTMDSPVPRSAPVFDPAFMEVENRQHLGSGNEAGMRDLVNSPGVMGRGMDTVSQASNRRIAELTDDDTLKGKITKSDI